jgi:hypothetical protein
MQGFSFLILPESCDSLWLRLKPYGTSKNLTGFFPAMRTNLTGFVMFYCNLTGLLFYFYQGRSYGTNLFYFTSLTGLVFFSTLTALRDCWFCLVQKSLTGLVYLFNLLNSALRGLCFSDVKLHSLQAKHL